MSLAIWYWIILVIWVLFTGWGWYHSRDSVFGAGNIVLIILLILLGLGVFGSPVKG